jgi:hypothetical protein
MKHRFLSVITDSYLQDKNKLQKDVRTLIQQCERVIYEGEQDVSKFVENLKVSVAKLNEKHKRCKAVEVRFSGFRSDNSDPYLRVANMTIKFYKSKMKF